MEAAVETTTDSFAELDERVTAAEAVVAAAHQEYQTAKAALDEAVRARDKVIEEREEEARRTSRPQESITNYLKLQAKLRADKAAEAAALREALGVTGRGPASKSPLDAAFARRTGRGGRRPQYPQAANLSEE